MSPTVPDEPEPFILQQTENGVEVLQAPDRIHITQNIIAYSDLVQQFILLPGDNLYRIEKVVRTDSSEGQIFECVKVSRPF